MTLSLCKYSNVLGTPNEGVHKYRFLNLAIVDVIMTVVVGFLISIIMNWSFFYSTFGFFLAGIILHRLFCVNTTIDKLLFSK